MTNATLRPLNDNDIPALLPIEQAAQRFPWSEGNFRSSLGGRYHNQVLELEGKIIGYYLGDHVAGDASLMNIVVDPAHQGQGYGRQLLRAFLEQTAAVGATAWFLEVRASNLGAIALYQKEEFVEYCRREGYYGKGNDREDAVLMSRIAF